MKFIRYAFVGGFAWFLSACSTTVPVQVRKIPEIAVPQAKTASVEDFGVSGSLNLDLVQTGGGVMGGLVQVATDIAATKLLADDKKNAQLARAYQDGLRGAIIRNGYYQIPSAGSGDAKLKGSVRYEVRDDPSTSTTRDSKGDEYLVEQIKRVASVEVQLLVFGKDGQSVGSSVIRQSAVSTGQGRTRADARGALKDWESLVREAMTRTWDPTVHKVAPYTVTEYRTFEKGGSKGVKKGISAAEDGDFLGAQAIWADLQNSSKKDEAGAARYNLAILAEVEGDLPKSLELYESAKALTGESEWSRDIARIRVRMDEERRLAELNATRTTSLPPSSSVVNSEASQEKKVEEESKSLNSVLKRAKQNAEQKELESVKQPEATPTKPKTSVISR